MVTTAAFIAQCIVPPLALVAAIIVITHQHLRITDLRDAHQATLARLHHDDLTGLLNRSGLRRNLNERLATGHPVAVVLIDVDDFKTINDTHGHAAGDLALRHLATQLTTTSHRESLPAVAARLSGDEFAVLIDGDMPAAQHLAREITRSLRRMPLTYDGVETNLHLSIGIAAHATTDGQLTVDDFLTRADHAMYHAKRRPEGSPHVATWTPGLRMPSPAPSCDRRTFRRRTSRASR